MDNTIYNNGFVQEDEFNVNTEVGYLFFNLVFF